MIKWISLISALVVCASAAPTQPTITVQNRCPHQIQVNQLTNDAITGTSRLLGAGKSSVIHVSHDWAGRIWARQDCDGPVDCQAAAPASLAEFRLGGPFNVDYYDVSLVDGFNLPISITPDGVADGYYCGAPSCGIPSCPPAFEVKEGGRVIACNSACRATGDCFRNAYTDRVKAVCPTVYTFPTDDSTSMFACAIGSFTVTFC